MNFSSAFLKLHRHRIQTFILNLGKCYRVVTLFGLLARTQACNAQHGALAWRQTQSCWWNGTKYSYCMLIHATRTLSINIPSFVLHYIVIAKTCQNHHSLNHNNLYPLFTRLIDQILYPFPDSHHILYHPSPIIIHPVLSDFLVLPRPSSWDTQRGSSAAEARGSGSWGPGVSSFKTKRLGCETRREKTFAVVSSLDRAVVRRNVIRQRPKNPCTTRQWGPWNYLQVMTSRSTIAIYFWHLLTIPVTTRSNARCTIMQNSHQTAIFPACPSSTHPGPSPVVFKLSCRLTAWCQVARQMREAEFQSGALISGSLPASDRGSVNQEMQRCFGLCWQSSAHNPTR